MTDRYANQSVCSITSSSSSNSDEKEHVRMGAIAHLYQKHHLPLLIVDLQKSLHINLAKIPYFLQILLFAFFSIINLFN